MSKIDENEAPEGFRAVGGDCGMRESLKIRELRNKRVNEYELLMMINELTKRIEVLEKKGKWKAYTGLDNEV